jgi:hypothetical protein
MWSPSDAGFGHTVSLLEAQPDRRHTYLRQAALFEAACFRWVSESAATSRAQAGDDESCPRVGGLTTPQQQAYLGGEIARSPSVSSISARWNAFCSRIFRCLPMQVA